MVLLIENEDSIVAHTNVVTFVRPLQNYKLTFKSWKLEIPPPKKISIHKHQLFFETGFFKKKDHCKVKQEGNEPLAKGSENPLR